MALNIDGVKGSLVTTCAALVGDKLSEVKTQSSTRPAVFKARQKPPRPEFPYISLDYLGSTPQGLNYRSSYFDDNKDLVYEYTKTLRFYIDVHSDTENGSDEIAIDLKDLLLTQKGKDLLEQYAENNYDVLVSVVNTIGPSFNPSLMNTDYEEVSRILIDLSVVNVLVDETVGEITSTEVNGELYEDYDQSEPPVDITVNAP